MNLNLNELEERYSKDAHYARSPEERQEALEKLELIKLAKLGQAAQPTERAFHLEVRAQQPASHDSLEGGDWFDPEDFASFLRERFTVERGAAYGLDAYNKNSPQNIVDVQVVEAPSGMDRPELLLDESEYQVVRVKLKGKTIAEVNYHDHGSDGLFTLSSLVRELASAYQLPLEVREAE